MNFRRSYAVRLAEAYSANILSLAKFSSVIQNPRLKNLMTKTSSVPEDMLIGTPWYEDGLVSSNETFLMRYSWVIIAFLQFAFLNDIKNKVFVFAAKRKFLSFRFFRDRNV